MEGIASTTIAIVALGAMLLMVLMWAVPVGLWIAALASGVRVKFPSLVGMRLRKVRPRGIILPLISATKAGLSLDTDGLEAHFLAGGDVERVVKALISADKANIELSFQQAAAIDVAG